jgi:hypothetical protein
VFDTIFGHVENPPPTSVANNAEAFAEWAADHLVNPAYVYSAYPGFTVKQIKAMATAAGVEGATELRPFLVILPARSRLAFAEMQLILRTMGMVGKVDKDMDSVGTPHFAQFVPLEDPATGLLYRIRWRIRQIHHGLHKKHRGSLRCNLQIHQGSAAVAMPKKRAGVH